MFDLFLILLSSLFLFSLDGERINNNVGDLAANQLLPGTPVSYMKWKYWDYYYDINGWDIYKDEYNVLKGINKRVSFSDNGEKLIEVSYEYYEGYDDKLGDIFLWLDTYRCYDSKGRLVSFSCSEYYYDLKYNEQNLVIEKIIHSDAGYDKNVYKYDNNGHCISHALYSTIREYDNSEALDPIFKTTPESVTYYTILKVDKHGNWISRMSDKGEIEERTIVYRNYKSKQ
jgi:hypothetical protein